MVFTIVDKYTSLSKKINYLKPIDSYKEQNTTTSRQLVVVIKQCSLSNIIDKEFCIGYYKGICIFKRNTSYFAIKNKEIFLFNTPISQIKYIFDIGVFI